MGPLALSPPHAFLPFHGPEDTVRAMAAAARGPRGERSMLVRSVTENVIRYVQAKDYLSELIAIRNYVASHVRYTNDALTTEIVKDPQRLVEEILSTGYAVGTGKGIGDCFPEGTLVLKEGHQLVPIQALQVGDRIWGLDKWVQVEGVAFKGELALDAIRLNNGSDVLLTPDHHVYVLDCPKHPSGYVADRPCYCPERVERRISVAELNPDMVLPHPARLPFGQDEYDPERAYVEGLYVSDGWSDQPSRFCISGQNGCPKEEQKHTVKRICDRLGLHTRWHQKYIAVNDREWALRMQRMGSPARNKHLLSLDFGEAAAAELLRGVMADSGVNACRTSRTFTTTSRQLAVQLRVLHKMFGVTCGASYIVNHGGLGTHPIWRLSTRQRNSDKAEKLLRVRSIERAVTIAPCWDIQTEDHRVYLPEHDVTVSQCDDIAGIIATMCRQLGREAQFVTVGFNSPNVYSHVFARAMEPKSRKWIVLDPVAGTDEAKMLRRVTTWRAWRID